MINRILICKEIIYVKRIRSFENERADIVADCIKSATDALSEKAQAKLLTQFS